MNTFYNQTTPTGGNILFTSVFKRKCKKYPELARLGEPDELTFFRQGNFIVALVEFNGFDPVIGVAKRNVLDSMRVDNGVRLAYGRALENFMEIQNAI